MHEFYRHILSGAAPDVALQTDAARRHSLLQTAEARPENIQQIEETQNAHQTRRLRQGGIEQTEDDYSHPYYWAPFVLIG